jgi:23S rRNA (cytosine1962-C5)-methyltransferase
MRADHVSSPRESLIDRALEARAALIESGVTDAWRVFHGQSDGVDGLVLERFGPALIVQIHEGRLAISLDEVRTLAELAMQRLGIEAAYLKRFVRDRAGAGEDEQTLHRDATPWIGALLEEDWPIVEHGVKYLIRPYDGFSVGLFLEQRDNRRRVRELAAGRRVLNAFCYTCGFSVCAALGGASSVASVDLSKRYLEWGRRNFDTNAIDGAPHRFYCSDIFDFYKRAARQGLKYDLIVLDPPTFSRQRRPKREFSVEAQLDALLAGAVERLDSPGRILFSTNARMLDRSRLERALKAATKGRRIVEIEWQRLPADFRGDEPYSRSVVVRID